MTKNAIATYGALDFSLILSRNFFCEFLRLGQSTSHAVRIGVSLASGKSFGMAGVVARPGGGNFFLSKNLLPTPKKTGSYVIMIFP